MSGQGQQRRHQTPSHLWHLKAFLWQIMSLVLSQWLMIGVKYLDGILLMTVFQATFVIVVKTFRSKMWGWHHCNISSGVQGISSLWRTHPWYKRNELISHWKQAEPQQCTDNQKALKRTLTNKSGWMTVDLCGHRQEPPCNGNKCASTKSMDDSS